MDRPDYGTCGNCGQPGPLNQDGYRRPHTRKEIRGTMILTIRCRNSRSPEWAQWRQEFKT